MTVRLMPIAPSTFGALTAPTSMQAATGMIASPDCQGVKARTYCMYWVRTNRAPAPPPVTRPETATETAKGRRANRLRSSSGASARICTQTNRPSTTRPTSAAPMTRGEARPRPGAEMTAQHSTDRPMIEAAMPSQSMRSSARSGAACGSIQTPPRRQSTASGTLTRKIDDQPKCARRAPDSSGPTAAPAPLAPDQMAKAVVRSAGRRKRTETSASVDGVSRAAPTPVRARAATSMTVPRERAATTEQAPNRATPVVKVRLRPQRSTRLPATSRKPA